MTPPTPPVPASTVVTLNADGTVTVVDNTSTLTADQLLAAIEKKLKDEKHTILEGSPKDMGGNKWKFETKTAQGFYKDYPFDANTGLRQVHHRQGQRHREGHRQGREAEHPEHRR